MIDVVNLSWLFYGLVTGFIYGHCYRKAGSVVNLADAFSALLMAGLWPLWFVVGVAADTYARIMGR